MHTPAPVSVLYVDDDPFSIDHVRALATDLKGKFKFRFFGSPNQAEKSHLEDPADIFISDLRMGSEDGLTLISKLQTSTPKSIYMLTSGAADLSAALSAVNNVKILKFFLKPVTFDTLNWALDEAVDEIFSQRFHQLSSLTLSAFEQVNTATILLDDSYTVILKNRSAIELLSATKAFSVNTAGKLVFDESNYNKKFEAWLAQINPHATKGEEPAIFRLVDELSCQTYILSAKYYSDDSKSARYYSIAISNPTRAALPTTKALSSALNISPSEARVVAGLIESGNVLEAAELSGVAVSTARTYLRAVFNKTGVSKQAELVRLALTSLQ